VQREEGRDSSSWNSSLSEDVREEEYEEWQKKPLEEPKKRCLRGRECQLFQPGVQGY
jgi:hypothetical protein